jgi:hypothetical protein
MRLAESTSVISDVFVIPPNQTLRLTGYCMGWNTGKSGTLLIQVVSPQQKVLSEFECEVGSPKTWGSFSRTFTTDGIPLECSVKLTNNDSPAALLFDSLSLVSP